MAPRGKSLLPTRAQLETLSDDKVRAIVTLADSESHRSHIYSLTGMICGTFSFIACLTVFTFLVMHGHEKASGAVLGTTVLAIVGRMIRGK